ALGGPHTFAPTLALRVHPLSASKKPLGFRAPARPNGTICRLSVGRRFGCRPLRRRAWIHSYWLDLEDDPHDEVSRDRIRSFRARDATCRRGYDIHLLQRPRQGV